MSVLRGHVVAHGLLKQGVKLARSMHTGMMVLSCQKIVGVLLMVHNYNFDNIIVVGLTSNSLWMHVAQSVLLSMLQISPTL